MGRGGNSSQDHNRSRGKSRKSKGRMSYLQRVRRGGGGGGGRGGKEDEFGQKYGDYQPAYGRGGKKNFGGQGGRRRENLQWGMTGFLCTTNFKENECVREAYNILNEYCEENDAKAEEGAESVAEEGAAAAAATVPEEKLQETMKTDEPKPEEPLVAGAASGPEGDPEDEDIDKALASELNNLRSENAVKKFQRVDTGVNNVVFISSTIENPTELAYRIFDDVFTKKQTKSRFLLRLLPVELTCNANNLDEVKSKAKEVIERHMKTGYISFRIVANIRLNHKLHRDELIKSLAELVSQVNPLSYVDLNSAQYTIVAEVLKTTLCLGIVKDFTKFKKYNLLEAGSNQPPASQASEKTNDEAPPTGSEAVVAPTENQPPLQDTGEANVEAPAVAVAEAVPEPMEGDESKTITDLND